MTNGCELRVMKLGSQWEFEALGTNRIKRQGTMELMRRLMFILLSALSLLLFAATVALWARSYFASDEVGHAWLNGRTCTIRELLVNTSRGQISVQLIRVDETPSEFASHQARIGNARSLWRSGPAATWDLGARIWNKLGFGNRRRVGPATDGKTTWGREVELTYLFPAWLRALLFAVHPGCCIVLRIRAARRFGTGQCKACGYDLRATPGRCPECGTVVSG